MKYLFIFLSFFYFSCSSSSVQYQQANNSLDAGREFIDACLKGDFEKARFFMLKNSENEAFLKKIEADYRTNDRDRREQYREASINIAEVSDITENETIINYSNSFDKIGKKVKVVKVDNQWLVDFSYTFNPNL